MEALSSIEGLWYLWPNGVDTSTRHVNHINDNSSMAMECVELCAVIVHQICPAFVCLYTPPRIDIPNVDPLYTTAHHSPS